MLLKDEAIALRFYPVGNTSTIGVWLTRGHGKLATRMKGNQRPRSRLLGQADLFYTCELLFYAREQRNVHILAEVTPLKTRDRLREDWRSCAVASYMAWMAERSLPFGPVEQACFTLLDSSLDRAAEKGAGPAYLLRFEARWLSLLGAMPDMDICARCRRSLAPGERGVLASDGHGMLCESCVPGEGHPISAGGRSALRALSSESEPSRAGLPPPLYREASILLERLVTFALDLSVSPRERFLALSLASLP